MLKTFAAIFWCTHGKKCLLLIFFLVFNRVYKMWIDETNEKKKKKEVFLFTSYSDRLFQFLIIATVRLVFLWRKKNISCIESFYSLSSLSTCNLTPRRICYILKVESVYAFVLAVVRLFAVDVVSHLPFASISNQLTVHCVDLFYCNCYPLCLCRAQCFHSRKLFDSLWHGFFVYSMERYSEWNDIVRVSLDNSRLF